MLHNDEDALICDFAETYHVFDWTALPVHLCATLAAGLRENSRSKLALAGLKVSFDTQLAAGIYDKLAFIAWSKTDDAQKGWNRPESIVQKLSAKQQKKESDKPIAYKTPEAFDRAQALFRAQALANKLGGA
jgi:hypothetical protein